MDKQSQHANRSDGQDDELRLRQTRKEVTGTVGEDVHTRYWEIVDKEREERPWTPQSHVLELLLRLGQAAYAKGWTTKQLLATKPPE